MMDPEMYQFMAMRSQADQTAILNRLYFEPGYGPKAMQLDNAARGLADDCGEVNGCIKKFIEYGQPLDVVNLKEEVGDCLWRLCQICDAAGFSLGQVMEANLEKLKIRYKDGNYSDAAAKEENRDRIKERKVLETDFPNLEHSRSRPNLKTCRTCGAVLDIDWDTTFDPVYCSVDCANKGKSFNQQVTQTGQGWAEPPIEVDPPAAVVAHFGDGLVREGNYSYNRLCSIEGCGVPIHRTNTAGICPDCMAKAKYVGGH